MFPELDSIMTVSELIKQFCMPFAIMFSAARSFMLPPGFELSIFANIRRFDSLMTRVSWMSGVLPIADSMPVCFMMIFKLNTDE